MKKTIFLFLLFPALCFAGIGLYGNPTPVIIHKGTNAPVLVKLFDADNSLLTAAEIAAITKIEVYYTPTAGGTPETTDSVAYSAGFDKTTYAARGEIMLKIGLVDFTAGRDRSAELIIYDATYTSGRVIGLLDMQVSADVEAGADMVDALTGQSYKFKTISIAGQSSVVADSNTDTLTLVAGTNITLTTDASADSVTITATGSGLADAPSDGTEYIRKDGAWANPTATGSGADGEAVLLQVADGYIQWKYASDVLWTNLIATADLEGDPGTPGVDGDDGIEITLQVADGYIQWSYVGSGSWTNLIATADLIGAPGPNTVSTTTTTNITGILKGNGTTVEAATSGTDYAAPLGDDDNYVNDAEKALLIYLDDPSEMNSVWQLTGESFSVTLNWLDRNTTEDGYIIERKTGSGGTFAYLDDVAENIETYTDTTGTLGQDYYYRVAAYTGADPEAPDTQSGYSVTVKVTMTAPAIDAADVALDDTNENTAEIEVEGAIDEIYGLISGLGGGHDAVTLSALLDSNLFSLSTQELGLDTQAANLVFAGPASGAAAAPAFRALTADDIPALPYLAAEIDGSTTNEINTVTGDNATTTSGLAIIVAGAGTVSTAVSGDTLTITGTGDGTGTDDQTASEVAVTTNNFGGHLANDATSDTVQECLDLLDDIVTGLAETAIDASSELAAIMDDETGTGFLVFGTAPTITTPTISNSVYAPSGSGDKTPALADIQRGTLSDKNLSGNADIILNGSDTNFTIWVIIEQGDYTISIVPPSGECLYDAATSTFYTADYEMDLSKVEGDKFVINRRYSKTKTDYVYDIETIRGLAANGGAGD